MCRKCGDTQADIEAFRATIDARFSMDEHHEQAIIQDMSEHIMDLAARYDMSPMETLFMLCGIMFEKGITKEHIIRKLITNFAQNIAIGSKLPKTN